MATIHREILIARPAGEVWDALRDFGALHRRLAPGFAIDVRLEGTDRIVTFADGAVARERLVSCDDARRRLAWSIEGEPFRHHNGVATVTAEGPERARFTWVTDLLPDALAERVAGRIDEGVRAIRAALEGGQASPNAMASTA